MGLLWPLGLHVNTGSNSATTIGLLAGRQHHAISVLNAEPTGSEPELLILVLIVQKKKCAFNGARLK